MIQMDNLMTLHGETKVQVQYGVNSILFGSNVHSMYRPDDSYCQSSSTTNLYSIPGLTNMCYYDASSIRSENRTNYGETYDKRGPLDRHNFVNVYK